VPAAVTNAGKPFAAAGEGDLVRSRDDRKKGNEYLDNSELIGTLIRFFAALFGVVVLASVLMQSLVPAIVLIAVAYGLYCVAKGLRG